MYIGGSRGGAAQREYQSESAPSLRKLAAAAPANPASKSSGGTGRDADRKVDSLSCGPDVNLAEVL